MGHLLLLRLTHTFCYLKVAEKNEIDIENADLTVLDAVEHSKEQDRCRYERVDCKAVCRPFQNDAKRRSICRRYRKTSMTPLSPR